MSCGNMTKKISLSPMNGLEASALKPYGPRQWFIAAAERLAGRGYGIASQHKWLTKGFLIWKMG